MFRTESWSSWIIGLVFGAASGLLLLLGAAAFLVLGVMFLALAFVAARSMAFLSGAFIGLGAVWVALTIRSAVSGEWFLFGLGVVLLAVGGVLGAVSRRRRAAA